MEEFKDIRQGQIWRVDTNFFQTSGKSNSFKRPILLTKNELIEIRYPFDWHFRTLDNNYWHAETDEILKHCKPFGIIWSKVRSRNNCNLSEIVSLGLFDKLNENQYNWAKRFDYEFLKRMKLNKLLSTFEEKHKKPE